MNDHCLHQKGDERTCCWCGGVQQQVAYGSEGHGPYVQQIEWRWEPKMAGQQCEARVEARVTA
jgi:hypothetical protein